MTPRTPELTELDGCSQRARRGVLLRHPDRPLSRHSRDRALQMLAGEAGIVQGLDIGPYRSSRPDHFSRSVA